MIRKWLVTIIAVSAMAFLMPMDSYAQQGKGGGKAGGKTNGGSGGKTNGGSGGTKSGGSTTGGAKGGTKTKPPVTNRGNSNSGGSGTKGRTGTGSTGSGRTTGGSTSGGTTSRPPTTSSRTGSSSRTKYEPFEKRSTSRSGRVVYDGTNNAPSTTRGRVGTPIPNAPRTVGSARLSRAVSREDRIRANDPSRGNGNYRSGYCHYDPFWVDTWFYYPHYGFDYRYGHSHPSPFYYYPHMPGYVLYTRINIGDFHFTILADRHYRWNRPSYRGGYSYPGSRRGDTQRYTDVDYAIDDIVRAFERGRIRYLDDILPRDTYVHIALEDYTDYRMDSEDFYDMMADLIEGSETRNYRIKDVMYERDQVVIYAEHEYRDPWGRTDRKYHTIVLEENRRGFEIAYFKVDRYEPR